MLRFWRRAPAAPPPDDEDWAIEQLRRPAYGPWSLLGLVVLVGAFATQHGWKRNQQLSTELEQARRQEREAKDLRVRFAALEAERATWQAEREKLDKDAHARKEAGAALQEIEKKVLEELREEITRGDVVLDRSETLLKIRFADTALFDSGGARLSPRGRRLLARVAPLLAAPSGHHLEIAGHTDDSPVPGKFRRQFPTGWDLSAGRASAVLGLLQEMARIPSPSLVASAHGPGKPLTDDRSPAGRAKNRRIEILLTARPEMRPAEKPKSVQARTGAPKKRTGPARRARVRM